MTRAATWAEGGQRGNAFRRDINALRAWAVLAVVGYHFQIPGFTGGFVGVDLFFVISGYLITGQVLSQLQEKRFSLLGFWLSRLRRIFPALFAVTVFAVALGWAFTMPGDYLKHIRQALSALAFASNLTLDGERGYFDAAAQTKPLLHTWSLSIEWQFYLALPLLLLMIWRLSPATSKLRAARWGLLLVAIASLSWCLGRGMIDPGSGFFSLRARLGVAGWQRHCRLAFAVEKPRIGKRRTGRFTLPLLRGRSGLAVDCDQYRVFIAIRALAGPVDPFAIERRGTRGRRQRQVHRSAHHWP